jgi:hypothetical protein
LAHAKQVLKETLEFPIRWLVAVLLFLAAVLRLIPTDCNVVCVHADTRLFTAAPR